MSRKKDYLGVCCGSLHDSEGVTRVLTGSVDIPSKGSNYAKEDMFDTIPSALLHLREEDLSPVYLIRDFDS